MKSIIFNQRVTVFTNSFIGYSENYKNALIAKFGDASEFGALQPNFALMVGPQQIVNPNQIPQGSPWFVKTDGVRVELMPNKIDVVSDFFVENEKHELERLGKLTTILSQINGAIPIGCITRIAYAPSWGLEESAELDSVESFWETAIGIPNTEDSHKQDKTIRYNTLCNMTFGSHSDVSVNRVVTITEGQRTETRKNANNSFVESNTIKCVIASFDINTNGISGNYSTDDVNSFCQNAQKLGRELIAVINR